LTQFHNNLSAVLLRLRERALGCDPSSMTTKGVKMDLGLSGILLLGLVIGLQHALEADHVAAVSSMVSGETSVNALCGMAPFGGLVMR
jgi:high-affinity nickel permease